LSDAAADMADMAAGSCKDGLNERRWKRCKLCPKLSPEQWGRGTMGTFKIITNLFKLLYGEKIIYNRCRNLFQQPIFCLTLESGA